jgi:DNA-directed RNA polymerase subunit F
VVSPVTGSTWDELRDAEQLAYDRRRAATHHGAFHQLDAERAERHLARLEMGDDLDD